MSDLIRRQDALDAFGLTEKSRKYGGDHSGYDTRMLYEIQDVLESLPSAEPERTAKVYKKQTTDRLYQFYCGECGQMIDCSFYEDYKSIKSYYGYCGAKLDWSE